MPAHSASSERVAAQVRARAQVLSPPVTPPLRLHRDDDRVERAARGAGLELGERERVERRLARAVREHAAQEKREEVRAAGGHRGRRRMGSAVADVVGGQLAGKNSKKCGRVKLRSCAL